MLQLLERVRIDLNDVKTVILILVTKNGRLQLWKKINCGKMGKSREKRWKITLI